MSRLNISPAVNKCKPSQNVSQNNSQKVTQNVNIIKRDLDDDIVVVKYDDKQKEQNQDLSQDTFQDTFHEESDQNEILETNHEKAYKMILDEITNKSTLCNQLRDRFGLYIFQKDTLIEILKLFTEEETIKITIEDYPVSCFYPIVYKVNAILVDEGTNTKNFKYVHTEIIELFKEWKISLKQVIYDLDSRE